MDPEPDRVKDQPSPVRTTATPVRQPGWQQLAFSAVFLVYLYQTAQGVATYSRGPARTAGYAILVAFVVFYLMALPGPISQALLRLRWRPARQPLWSFWFCYLALLALYLAELGFARQGALAMLVFIVALTIAGFRRRSIPAVVALTLVSGFLPPLIPAWHSGVNFTGLLVVSMVALAMYGFFGLIDANQQLREARSEVARLATENERNRIARDLHDLLGHSLTTITIKAGLARRLAGSEPARAALEIAEVEELSRRSLAEVRATLANYHQVSLASELASGRELLRAAGIATELRRRGEAVDPARQELLGWVLREGLTNVVRHSHATVCRVSLDPDSVEIVDNGEGGAPVAGRGLTGLRERVEAVGGVVEAGPALPRGWRLRVRLLAPS